MLIERLSRRGGSRENEAERKVHLVTMPLSACLASTEAGSRGQAQRAHRLENELRSAQAEAGDQNLRETASRIAGEL